jgi:hypothetical protein
VLVSIAALGGHVDDASAYVEPPLVSQPFNTASDSALMTALQTAETTTDMTGFEATFAGESAAARTGATRAAMAARVLPSMGTLGTIGLVATAGYVGWKIGGAIDRYFGISGQGYAYTGTVTEPWVTGPGIWKATPGVWTASNDPEAFTTPGYIYQLHSGVGNSYLMFTGALPGFSYSGCWGGPVSLSCLERREHDAEQWYLAGTPNLQGLAGTLWDGHNYGGPTDEGDRKVRWASQTQMDAAVTLTPITSSAYAALPSGEKVTNTTYTEPTHTSGDATAARAALTSGSHEGRDFINQLIDPTYEPEPETGTTPNCAGLTTSACTAAIAAAGFTEVPSYTAASFAGADVTKPAGAVITQPVAAGVSKPLGFVWPDFTVNPDEDDMPFVLPRPNPDETYEDYSDRLVADGYLGTITTLELTEETASVSVGPLGVSRIKTKLNATAVTSTLLVPVETQWETPVKIRTSEPIELAFNPATMPATGEDTWPVGGGGGGSGSCDCPPVDFSPLTGLDLGSNFPFGLFAWIGDALDVFDVSPITPDINWPIKAPAAGVDTTFDMDLHFWDTYMGWMRALETFFLWASALWFVAAKFLKLDWAGQPDDGMELFD